MTRPWFRCYVPPCGGDRRTDATWERHWNQHHRHQDGKAVEKPGGHDLLPVPRRRFIDGSTPVATGKDLQRNRDLAAREEFRQAREARNR